MQRNIIELKQFRWVWLYDQFYKNPPYNHVILRLCIGNNICGYIERYDKKYYILTKAAKSKKEYKILSEAKRDLIDEFISIIGEKIGVKQ